jgi:hypothetical protein
MYLGDGLAGSCKIQRWLESYSCETGTSRRRVLVSAPRAGRRVLGRVSKTSLCGKASGQFWKAGNCREISLRPRHCNELRETPTRRMLTSGKEPQPGL